MATRSFLLALCTLFVATGTVRARPFTVLVYNVENLFDADGISVYDDYKPNIYTPFHMRTKVATIAQVVSKLDGGKGPDIMLFQEIEIDRSPNDEPSAEARLVAALKMRGITGYTVISGDDSVSTPHEDGHPRAIHCVVFTRFPVKAVRNHPTESARNILEVELQVDGATLYVFNNHWKSGASDPAMEKIRVANARTLRNRIDQILKADPHADIIIGGDFNSQYNQSRRFGGTMLQTGINDVLRSQGNELAVRGLDRDLYNLWFELPNEQRGSDVYRGEWGTLMQIIISRGLYDYRGVQYVDNSLAILKVPGLNATEEGTPLRWSNAGPAGSGASDHFPIYARFVTVNDNQTTRWLSLQNPSRNDESPTQAVKAPERRYDLTKAVDLTQFSDAAEVRNAGNMGKLFVVRGKVMPGSRIAITALNDVWEVWIPDAALRSRVKSQWREGMTVTFHGLLGQHSGKWQFEVEREDWVKP
ncbi:MAG: hypothetical protein JNN01_11395 [Opitutaceae bacterium]|nr:hypothetical protein [Opitutaceae bacterium]